MNLLKRFLVFLLLALQVAQPAMAAGFLDNLTDTFKSTALQTVGETLASGFGIASKDPKAERAMNEVRRQDAQFARRLFSGEERAEDGPPATMAGTEIYDPADHAHSKRLIQRWKKFIAKTKGKASLSSDELREATAILLPFERYYLQGNGKQPTFQGNMVSIPAGKTVRFNLQGYCMDRTTPGPAAGEKLQLVPIGSLIPEDVLPLYQGMMQYSALHLEARPEMQNLVWGLRHAADATPPIRQLNARQSELLNAAYPDGAAQYQNFLSRQAISGQLQDIRKKLFRQALGKIQDQTHIALPDPSAAGYSHADTQTVLAALTRMPVDGSPQADSDYTLLAPGVAAKATANDVHDVHLEIRNTNRQPYLFDANQYAGQSTRVTQRVAFGGLPRPDASQLKAMLQRRAIAPSRHNGFMPNSSASASSSQPARLRRTHMLFLA